MKHILPGPPAFLDEPLDSPICEIALRVLVELRRGNACCGYCYADCRPLGYYRKARTGGHHLKIGAQRKATLHSEVRDYALWLYQVLPGPIYRVWNVYSACYCETDIAILHLGLFKRSDPETIIDWKTPLIRAMPPPLGQKVIAFGYRHSTCQIMSTETGGYHLELNDKPTTSIGEVKRIDPMRRDSAMLSFP